MCKTADRIHIVCSGTARGWGLLSPPRRTLSACWRGLCTGDREGWQEAQSCPCMPVPLPSASPAHILLPLPRELVTLPWGFFSMPLGKIQIIKFTELDLSNTSPSPDSPFPGSDADTLPWGFILWLPMAPAGMVQAVPTQSTAPLHLQCGCKSELNWQLTFSRVSVLQRYSTQVTAFFKTSLGSLMLLLVL